MKAKITSIREAGNIQKERVVIKAIEAIQVGEHMILRTASPESTITNGVTDSFWFPDKEIAAGDFVVLYTKKGKDSEKEFNGAMSHFFYWGKTEPIWNEPGYSAVLIYAPEWVSLPAGK